MAHQLIYEPTWEGHPLSKGQEVIAKAIAKFIAAGLNQNL